MTNKEKAWFDRIENLLDKYKEGRNGMTREEFDQYAIENDLVVWSKEMSERAMRALEQQESCDCISREWIKTAIHNFYYGLTHTPTEEDIQAYLDAAPSVQPKTGWIPVGERLPEETESVLVYAERNAYDDKGVFRKKVIDIGWQVDGRWHIDGCNGVDGIAWMPLPPSYQGK